MSLEELINLKLKNLYVENEKAQDDSSKTEQEKDELEKVREDCEDFIHLMSEGWENVKHQDTKKLTKHLIKYSGLAYNEDEINENFRLVKLVYEAIEFGLDTTLTETQIDFVRGYIGSLMQIVKDLDEKIRAKEELVSTTKESRDLMLELLDDTVNNEPELLATKYIYSDIKTLERNKKG